MAAIVTGIVFALALNCAGLEQSSLLPPESLELVLRGEEFLLNGRWDDAYRLYDELGDRSPGNPAVYLFRAAVLQAEMTDREENIHGRRFSASCDSTESAVRSHLRDCSAIDSALCYLFLGHQYAYRSLYEGRFGSKLAAFRNGRKARKAYAQGLRVDSTLYDLYLGLGLYHYWKSVRAGILKTAGIFKDERDRGLGEISLAADSACFSRTAARSALIWVMINEKRYDSAISICRAMLEQFSQSNTFYWPLAEALFRSEQYSAAIENYSIIFDRLVQSPGNYYNILECAYYLHRAYRELDREDKAAEVSDYVRSVNDLIPAEVRRAQKDKLAAFLGRRRY